VAERARAAWRDGVAPGSLGDDDLLATLPQLDKGTAAEVLIDAVTLRQLLGQPDPPAVLDVRWALGDTRGRDHYRAGHIPTAVYVDLDTQLAAARIRSAGGIHCPMCRRCRKPHASGACAPAGPWSSTTTAAAWPRRAPGGC